MPVSPSSNTISILGLVGAAAVALVVFFAFGPGRGTGDEATIADQAADRSNTESESVTTASTGSDDGATTPSSQAGTSATSAIEAESVDGASSKGQATTTSAEVGSGAGGDRPIIHLTFDDGPSELTPRVMDLLEQYGARGTFFVMGQAVEDHPDIARGIVDRGHAIANHSYDHMDWRQPGAREDIITTQEIIHEVTGVTPSCARPPFGADSPELLETLADLGMTSWRWDLATEDHTEKRFEVEETLKTVPVAQKIWSAEGLIVLQHDSDLVLGPSIDGLEAWLADHGSAYEFKVIDGCLDYQQ